MVRDLAFAERIYKHFLDGDLNVDGWQITRIVIREHGPLLGTFIRLLPPPRIAAMLSNTGVPSNPS